MHLTPGSPIKFDRFLPVYNWYYPMSNAAVRGPIELSGVFDAAGSCPSLRRALYVHIPFCDTICSFCPFERSAGAGNEFVEAYVAALVREIQLKAEISSVRSVPVDAIFFGGGTPSLLSSDQIRIIGSTLRDNFDLSELREWSFEVEVKSVTLDKLEALSEVGVSHIRFGAQTFQQRYRDLFSLTATIEQIEEAARILVTYFPNVSCDILYGINGETEDDFCADIERAADLGLPNIDFYPLNNVASQRVLHRSFEQEDLAPTSGLTKFYMNLLLREVLKSKSYLPHNGHGYVRVDSDELARNPVITDKYTFWYHHHVYGYSDRDILGFGVSAISSLKGHSLFNTNAVRDYVQSLHVGNEWNVTVGRHSASVDASKPIAMRLPYHGSIQKDQIDWESVAPETQCRLQEVVSAGLVAEKETLYELTFEGWASYVNLMYYLSPSIERERIDSSIERRSLGRRIGVLAS